MDADTTWHDEPTDDHAWQACRLAELDMLRDFRPTDADADADAPRLTRSEAKAMREGAL